RVPSPRWPPHQQHARPPDAGDESVLRPWSTPAWLGRGLPAALPRLGAAVALHPLASGDDPGERGLAVPCGAVQPAPLPRLLAAEPADVRVAGRIPLSTPPKSVTVRNFIMTRRTTCGRAATPPGAGPTWSRPT